MGFSSGSVVKNLPANEGDTGSISGTGRSPGEGNGNPLRYSCLRNPVVKGAWAIVHGVTKESDMTWQLKNNNNVYIEKYYSAIKRKEIVQFAETWRNLETAIQSKVSQKEKNKYIISLIYRI